MSRTLGLWIQNETVSILTVIISVVRRFHEKGDEAWFHLLDDVNNRVSERTTCINTSFTFEIDPVNPTIYIFMSEISHMRITLILQLLNDLAKYAVFAFMVNPAFICVLLSRSPIYSYDRLVTFAYTTQSLVDLAIDGTS